MAGVHLDVSLAEALVRLRTHTSGNNVLIIDVAVEVVACRLHFDDPHRQQTAPETPRLRGRARGSLTNLPWRYQA